MTIRIAAVLVLFSMGGSLAQAGGWQRITGSGTFGPDAPSSEFSEPGGTWAFELEFQTPIHGGFLPEPFYVPYFLVDGQERGGIYHAVLSNVQGLTFLGSLDVISFRPQLPFPIDDRGNLYLGNYPVSVEVNGSGNVDGVGTFRVVPEPASAVLIGVGMASVVGLVYARHRRGMKRGRS